MNTVGRNIKLSVFGDSHGPAVGLTLDGLPAGMPIDMAAVAASMAEPLDGATELGGAKAPEPPVAVCGLRGGRTDGQPLTLVMSVGEDPVTAPGGALRPGYPDLALFSRTGVAENRGGAYSGRRAAALRLAGVLCREPLIKRGVQVTAKLIQIGSSKGGELTFDMKKEMLDARGSGDSVGSLVECTVTGVPGGLGSPSFGGLESAIAALLFAVPGVKGVEFGAGFGFPALRGSAANDQLVCGINGPVPITNSSGGLDDGVTTGQPIVLRAALRPSPCITREQRTVDTETGGELTLRLRGRNEPCLGPRAAAAIEGAVSFCLLDALLDAGSQRP